jgi:hypothetical protein
MPTSDSFLDADLDTSEDLGTEIEGAENAGAQPSSA